MLKHEQPQLQNTFSVCKNKVCTSDGTIYRIVSNIAILIHIVAYLYRDNYPSNEVDIPHNSAIRPWFILAIIKLM